MRVRALGLNVTNTEIVYDKKQKRKKGQSSALEQNFKKCLLNLSTLLTWIWLDKWGICFSTFAGRIVCRGRASQLLWKCVFVNHRLGWCMFYVYFTQFWMQHTHLKRKRKKIDASMNKSRKDHCAMQCLAVLELQAPELSFRLAQVFSDWL